MSVASLVPSLRLAPFVPARVVSARRHRRTHGGRGGRAEGDGVRDDRAAAAASRAVHRHRADGGLRPARIVATAQRQHHDDHRHSDRGRTRRARRLAATRRRSSPPRPRSRCWSASCSGWPHCSAWDSSRPSSPTRCSPASSRASAWSSWSTSSRSCSASISRRPGSSVTWSALAQQLPETSIATLLLAVALLGTAGGARAPGAACARASGRHRPGDRGIGSAGSRGTWCRDCGRRRRRPAASRVAEPGPGRSDVACRGGYRAHEFHREHRGRARIRRRRVSRVRIRIRNCSRSVWPTSAGGVLGAMPSGGGTSQTAVNRLAGARSQVAATGHRRGRAGDVAAARSGDCADATGGAGRGGRVLFAGADQAGRVHGDPSRPAHRIPLGRDARLPAWCCSAR